MKLKKCPFCGSEVEHESTITEETIRCTLCPAKMNHGGSAKALQEMWNYRKEDKKEKNES